MLIIIKNKSKRETWTVTDRFWEVEIKYLETIFVSYGIFNTLMGSNELVTLYVTSHLLKKKKRSYYEAVFAMYESPCPHRLLNAFEE